MAHRGILTLTSPLTKVHVVHIFFVLDLVNADLFKRMGCLIH